MVRRSSYGPAGENARKFYVQGSFLPLHQGITVPVVLLFCLFFIIFDQHLVRKISFLVRPVSILLQSRLRAPDEQRGPTGGGASRVTSGNLVSRDQGRVISLISPLSGAQQ